MNNTAKDYTISVNEVGEDKNSRLYCWMTLYTKDGSQLYIFATCDGLKENGMDLINLQYEFLKTHSYSPVDVKYNKGLFAEIEDTTLDMLGQHLEIETKVIH